MNFYSGIVKWPNYKIIVQLNKTLKFNNKIK